MSAGLNGVAVLRTLVERRVQPLKLWARLLCDYAGLEDPSWETREMLEANEVIKQVTGLVMPATIFAVENTMEAFSATYRPNLVSPFLLRIFFSFKTLNLVNLIFVARDFLHLPIPTSQLTVGAPSTPCGRRQPLRRRNGFTVRR